MFFRKNKLQKSNIKNILKIVMMQEISSSRTLSQEWKNEGGKRERGTAGAERPNTP